MNDAATIHALTQSNATLHERMAALSIQRDAFRQICVDVKEAIDYDHRIVPTRLNEISDDIESALAIHR